MPAPNTHSGAVDDSLFGEPRHKTKLKKVANGLKSQIKNDSNNQTANFERVLKSAELNRLIVINNINFIFFS